MTTTDDKSAEETLYQIWVNEINCFRFKIIDNKMYVYKFMQVKNNNVKFDNAGVKNMVVGHFVR